MLDQVKSVHKNIISRTDVYHLFWVILLAVQLKITFTLQCHIDTQFDSHLFSKGHN